ncbi:MAG: RtcB family protein, partial [Candidatus Spechtbacteria bacterium]|nr:RtcB family protein [Candidatus Spechtbacteria bacterium]
MRKSDFTKINDYLWEVPKSFRSDMRVPARVYVTGKMLEESFKDSSLDQLINLATLPGIQKYSIGMPDIHEGYGAPIGGVAAIDVKEGVISPGLIGYDMNCGMRLLTSELTADFIQSKLDAVATEIQKEVPSGLGKGRQLKFNIATMDRILEGGSEFIIGRGYGDAEDLANCEEQGKMRDAHAI